MSNKPLPRQVSVRGEVYDRLRAEADHRGVSISNIVEAALGPPETWPMLLDRPAVDPLDVERNEPASTAPPLEPRTFVCASCTREVNCVPTREPWGRDGAMVDVCATCCHEHPRQGRYAFDNPTSAPMGVGDGNRRVPGGRP